MPYKNIEDRIAFNKRYWQKNKDKLKLQSKNWRINNKEKLKISKRKYFENNRNKINVYEKNRYNNISKVKFKKSVRRNTILKYGKLKEGFVYHHNTEPYNIDKFDILEKDFHIFYHKNPEIFNMAGRL